MALKNISIIEEKVGSEQSRLRLIDDAGHFIESFDYFYKALINRGYSYSTNQRYLRVVAKFIDYLYEMGVLGAPATVFQINEAIDFYPIFLRDGKTVNALDKTDLLKNYAAEINFENGLSTNSFPPVLAAVNMFLEVAQILATEAAEKVKQINPELKEDKFELIINAIYGTRNISHFEKKRLMQNSVLGSVIRLKGSITKPHKLRSPLKKRLAHGSNDKLDFPLKEIGKLIEASTSYRDKALWSLLAASGVRLHEALNLRLEHIDPANQLVFIEDPNLARFGGQMTKEEKKRFKGRTTSRTFLFEPLKSKFFEFYELYLLNEFVATPEHDFFFQILEKSRRGEPLKNASDAALAKNFKKTTLRAEIFRSDNDSKDTYTIHSLRHAYGVYMLNYVPVPGGAGLRITEVQQMMGHKNIESTMHYARHEEVLLKAKLEIANSLIYGGNLDFNDLSRLIGEGFEMVKFK